MEILEARETVNSVQRQVKNLQTLQIFQPFNLLQLVPPLEADRKEDALKEARNVKFMNKCAYIIGFQPGVLLCILSMIPTNKCKGQAMVALQGA